MNKCLIFAAGFALLGSPALGQGSPRPAEAVERGNVSYDPTINPADFTHVITNKYYALKPGMKATYEKKSPKGIKRVEIEVTGETKKVMGVTALVVRDREWLNDELQEDTRDWVAQDKGGNVWYFGEAVDNYEDGKLVNHDGSWEAGVDGGKPGIVMLGEPKPGDTYRQEYLPGKAEDMGTVVAVGKRVTVPQATYEDCVQIRDWSQIKEGESEHKYFCAGAGLVLEEEGEDRLELVSLSTR
jgi:hypothetical protein